MVQLTMLNSMADPDFAAALDRHLKWGLHLLDLKDCIFGKGIGELTVDEAERAAEMIRARGRGLEVYCFSTGLMGEHLEKGEAHFRHQHLERLEPVLASARILRPKLIRLLACQTTQRRHLGNDVGAAGGAAEYIQKSCRWAFDVYREMIDRIHAAGCTTVIENEIGDSIFSTPREVCDFFTQLGRADRVRFTWDIANLWQMGTFPSIEVYEQLKPWIGFVHVKGGMDAPGRPGIAWASALEDASWPVLPILRRVVADGVSPVLCLNSSHGVAKGGYDYSNVAKRDLDFLRQNL